MRMYDLIYKKREGKQLTKEEINFMVSGYTKEEIPDYQMSSMLMAIYFKGMNEEETSQFTEAVVNSGEKIDLSSISGFKVDKHSTGGVGDKTTLIVAPIVATYGVKVAKMSGRGLGHTGGTVDKMESIPGMKTTLEPEKFVDIVNEIGVSVIGQSANLAPADKKLYALRDVTATVDSIPLIACSIMSKKLAAGNDAILLDVKTGSGAFMKTPELAIELARQMVSIGENAGKKTVALITEMDIPLGKNVGNTLEIKEVIETLKGNGPKDLTDVCINLAANMMYLAEVDTLENCKNLAKESIKNGKALDKFLEFTKAQGADISYLKDLSKFETSKLIHEVKAVKDGYITNMNTENIGNASTILGAGRIKKEDLIDFSAGICLEKKTGDYVKAGDVISIIHTNNEKNISDAEKLILESYTISSENVKLKPLILAKVSSSGVEKYF